LLGGWITENYSWEWIFIINVPIGIMASFIIRQQMGALIGKVQNIAVDYVGLAALVIGVGALQIMLDIGNDADWFNSLDVILLTIVAVVGLIVFVVWELLHDDPIVNLRLLKHRNYRNGSIAFVVAYAGFFSINLLLPLWMQRVMGYSSFWAGMAAAPIGILPILLTRFVGQNAHKVDLRYLTTVAFLVLVSTCYYRSMYFVQLDFFHVAIAQLVMGLGVAFFFMPIMTIFLSDLQGHEIAAGSGLTTFMRTVAGSFAASITTFMWEQRAAVQHARLTEHITPYNEVSVQALAALKQATGSGQAALAALNQSITQQAYQIAFNELFYALTIIFLLLIPVVWTTKPPFTPKTGGGDAGH
jgi:DHA2 family multidrug resistance protein